MKKISINFNTKNLDEKIQTAKSAFDREKCLEFDFDLSKLNLIDASRTVLLLSAELMKKNKNSKINCKLKDKTTMNIIAPRKLKNIFLSVNLENNVRDIEYNTKIFRRTGNAL